MVLADKIQLRDYFNRGSKNVAPVRGTLLTLIALYFYGNNSEGELHEH